MRRAGAAPERWLVWTAAVLLAALLPGAGPLRAQEPDPPLCCRGRDEPAGHAALEEGVRLFLSTGRRDDAGEPLCRAACCWPRPDPEVRIDAGVVRTAYLPFYWRGRFHLESGRRDTCLALRDLNLAACEWEAFPPAQRRRLGISLEELAARARRERPATPGAFRRALADFKGERWRSAALHMMEAVRRWDEDGEVERVQGRWPDRYLPRNYLARALLQLGCRREAVGVLRCSQVSRCQLRGREGDPAPLLRRAEAELAELGPGDGEVCGEMRRHLDDLRFELDLDLEGCCTCAGC